MTLPPLAPRLSRPLSVFLLAMIASPAPAQVRGMSTTMELDGGRLAVSGEEMRALSDLGLQLRSGVTATQDRALLRARRVANSRDARYALAHYELALGDQRGDDAMRGRALDVLIASDFTAKSKLPGYLAARGRIAWSERNLSQADALWSRWAALAPNDADARANLAQVKLAAGDARAAEALLGRAIQLRKAAGPKASEAWYRQRLGIAQQGRLASAGADAARALVGAYPTRANWRSALMAFHDLSASAGPAEVDLLRLMRHLGLLAQAAEYQRTAQLLQRDGAPEEAKAVLSEGLTRRLLDARTSPTREIAAEVDRALARPSARPASPASAAAARVRRAANRLVAGDRARAEAELRAVAEDPTAGPHADLAKFWLLAARQARADASAAPVP